MQWSIATIVLCQPVVCCSRMRNYFGNCVIAVFDVHQKHLTDRHWCEPTFSTSKYFFHFAIATLANFANVNVLAFYFYGGTVNVDSSSSAIEAIHRRRQTLPMHELRCPLRTGL
jgi:hypothetical protein